jgi:phospholipid-binding lipoprotein MlaA
MSKVSQKLRQLVCYIAGLIILNVLVCTVSYAAEIVSEPADVTINDPYESYNRPVFAFNDAFDTYVLQPIARLYIKIIPKPLNQGIHNFFLNLGSVTTIADDLLQLNLYQMTNDLWRLTINSTIGVGGLFDVASRMNLKYYENDFGLTLATWGYHQTNYIVLPFYGSYTVRDGLALPVDWVFFSAYPYIEPPKLRFGLYGLAVIDWRAQTLQYNNLIDAAAIDKYAFVRNAYLQRRAYQVEQNKHLGLYERENPVEEAAMEAENPGNKGAAANIDEAANIGQPANTEAAVAAPLKTEELQ